MFLKQKTIGKPDPQTTITANSKIKDLTPVNSKSNERSLNWQIERILKDWLIEKGELKREDLE